MKHKTNRIGGALLSASLLLAGCAADATGSDPTPRGAEPKAETTEASGAAKPVTEDRRAEATAATCSPLACCFPTSGGGWADNPLEVDLRVIGCSTPKPYEELTGELLEWTRCPLDIATLAVVYKYRGTPYDAKFIENACLGFVPDTVVVEFDPICGTCFPQ
jgi:hypothetical protein